MKIFLNRSQLSKVLGIAPQTLKTKIETGEFTPDAKDGRGEDLFDAGRAAPCSTVDLIIAQWQTKNRIDLRNGKKLPGGKTGKQKGVK